MRGCLLRTFYGSPCTVAWLGMRIERCRATSRDPTFRLIGSEKIWDRGAALPSRLQTFETDLLAEDGNFAGLARVNRELMAMQKRSIRRTELLDMVDRDSGLRRTRE